MYRVTVHAPPPYLVALQKGVEHAGEERQCCVSSLRYHQLMLGDLHSASLAQQVAGLLKVLQAANNKEETNGLWLASATISTALSLNPVPYLNCGSRTEDELIRQHVSEEAESVENLLWRHKEVYIINCEEKKIKVLNVVETSTRAHTLTFAIGRGWEDGRGQQSWSDEQVQDLVPVGGAGEDHHSLAQELLLRFARTARLRWSRPSYSLWRGRTMCSCKKKHFNTKKKS